jgi:histidine ammonia-lyase
MFLSPGSAAPNGLAPVIKISESILAAMMARATPVAIWPSAGADGVEDAMTQSLQAGQNLAAVVAGLERITAIELMVAAQAIELRGAQAELNPTLAAVLALTRSLSPALLHDRPLGPEIDSLTAALARGAFSGLA